MNDKKRKMTVVLLVVVSVITVGTGSLEGVRAQMTTSNMTGSQNQTNMNMGTNITGSIPFGPTIAKAIGSQIHVSLANATTIAEKAVGTNANADAARIGVVNGFLVYMALVLDNNNNSHGVLVDPGTGKVLSNNLLNTETMMRSGMGTILQPELMMLHSMMGTQH
jgi:uncharacterized membrane protein YkoI